MKHFIYLFIIFLNLAAIQAFSQSITTDPLDSTEYCVGSDITVNFTADGDFEDNNVFIAQISNDDFSHFRKLGSIKSKTSGTIEGALPDDLEKGDNYRIRVVSSNPYVVGSDNGSDIAVLDPNCYDYYPSIFIKDANKYQQIFEKNQQIQFDLDLNKEYSDDANWYFGDGADPQTYTGYDPPTVSYTTTGQKEVTFDMKLPKCCKDRADDSKSIYIANFDCTVEINSSAIVDSTSMRIDSFSKNYHHYWIMPNGMLEAWGAFEAVVIVEIGGEVKIDQYAGNTLFYLKPASSLIGGEFSNCVVIKEKGASVEKFDTTKNNNKLIECEDLEYVYDKAPKKGIEILIREGFLDVVEHPEENEMTLYPNPATDMLYIDNNLSTWEIQQAGLELYNIYGEIIPAIEHKITSERISVDVSALNPGIYYITLSTNNTRFVKKFTVIK